MFGTLFTGHFCPKCLYHLLLLVFFMSIQASRVQSPSSINTFKQCPRKYYYQYVERLPTGTSIHLVRGGIVHKVLEDFYDVDLVDERTRNFRFLHLRALSLLKRYWDQNAELKNLGLSDEELQAYYDESVLMIQRWFDRLKKKLLARMEQGESFVEAFKNLTPRREEEYRSEEFMVRGFVDVIHELDGQVIVMDYKTSKSSHITDEYRLQLAIYAMLYEEKHGRKPDYVGIDFLKSVEQVLKVDDDLVKQAKFEIEQVHASTLSKRIEDYPQRPSPLCKWRTGQCDFYDLCFGGMTVEEFRRRAKK